VKISKKEYIDNQVQWLKAYSEAEIKSVREAVNKVEATNNQKFEAQNEWRSQFKDQTGTFLTRREFWGGVLAIAIALVAIYFKK
jgi:hypothetical protein